VLSGGLGFLVGGGEAPEIPEVEGRPARIVSATLSTDEMLLAMVEPAELIAVTHFALDPRVSNVVERAREVPHVVTGDAEQLVSLEPDVVLADPVGRAETRALLTRVGVPVWQVPPAHSVEDVERNVRSVAVRIGMAERGEALVAEMERVIDEASARVRGVEPPTVLLYNRGGFTAGAGTLFDELLRLAGGRNAAAEAGIEGHASIAIERALALDPDVILTTDYAADGRSRRMFAEATLADDPAWRATRAVREGRVHGLSGRTVLSTSHHVARAVPEIARLLHPERFR
jgi:iron complex transport system substrate-binding protein